MKHKPAPLSNPDTLQPMTEKDLSVVFAEGIGKAGIRQYHSLH